MLIAQTLEPLEDEGVELLTAGDGETALGVVEQHRPELGFLDVMMPRRNGLEVCRTIKQELGLGDTSFDAWTAGWDGFTRAEAALQRRPARALPDGRQQAQGVERLGRRRLRRGSFD